MNTKRKITFAVLLLIACGAMSAYADVYHYPDRIEINGEPVMVSGSPWTDSQDMNGETLSNGTVNATLFHLGTNEYFYFGDSDESYMYENGTALIIGRN